MKQITVKIPTSLSEIRQLFKEKTDRKFAHNKSVLIEFAKEIRKTTKSGYWVNDISSTMKERVFGDNINSELNQLLTEAIKKLK